MPLLLARSPSTSVYSNTATLHQVSLISDWSSLSFISFDISKVSHNDLPSGNRWNLSHRQSTYTPSNPVNISLNESDSLIGFSRLITPGLSWVPVLWILFCNYTNSPMINLSPLVSENVVPPCDVPHSLFTPELFIYLLPLPVSLRNIIKYSYKEPQSQTKAPFLQCLPSEKPSAENREKTNWAAWVGSCEIYLYCCWSVETLITCWTTANCSVLFDPHEAEFDL